MKNKTIYIFIAAAFALLIHSPGRFVYGFTLVIELNLIFLIGTLSHFLLEKIKLEKLNSFLILFFIISFTTLFKEIMIFFQPELILTLGINIYILPISLFVFGFMFEKEKDTLQNKLKYNMTTSLKFSIFTLIFYLFRDLVGFGTFTFYGPNHQIYEKILIESDKIGFFSIFASIPGAILLFAIFLFVYILINKKFSILENAGVEK